MKLYIFKSTNVNDKCSYITILTKDIERAYKLAVKQFIKYDYIGRPIAINI
uniref:Uncharacterized protein n=1 Tax=Geladintestivirus 2 TaxID=3233134 RepID=A0AAU8MLR5_9CAUD